MRTDAKRLVLKALASLSAGAFALTIAVSPLRATAAGSLTPEQTKKIATDVYIYGYSLVTSELTRLAFINTVAPNPRTLQAPMNQLVSIPAYPPADYKGVTAPNADTLYTAAFFDLSKEPIVFSYPDMGKRFFLFPLYDEYTQVVAVPGTRTTGGAARNVLLTGPGWHGTVPAGMTQVKMPTNVMFMIGRVYCDGSVSDLAAVHALQSKFKAVPLSKYGAAYAPPPGTAGSKYSVKDVVRNVISSWTTQQYFDFLSKAMVKNPPVLPQDSAIVAEMAQLGFVPGKRFDMASMSADQQKAIAKIGTDVDAQLAKLKTGGGTVANGWLIPGAAGSYGTKYALRAMVSAFGWGANLPEDAIYPTATGGATPFSGANTYKIHFAKGMTPPVRGFWSITMYDGQFYFYPNALKKQTVSMRDHPKFNADGSLDLYFAHAQPSGVAQSNWLPAPSGTFILMMRLYWPNSAPPSILDRSWLPPPVTSVR